MQKLRYVVAVLLIVLALVGAFYYLFPGLQFRNVDLIKGTTTSSLVGIDVSRVAYYPGAVGYLAIPNLPGRLPGVVMIHEWWGLNDNIKGMAQQLAKEGYVVLAVDLYNGNVASTPNEASSLVSKLNSTEAVQNLRAAVNYLRSSDRVNPTRIGSIGWCFGGGQSLRLALSGEQLVATVIYYGQLETDPTKLSVIKWPVLGIFGDQDQSIPVERVRAFESSLKQLGVPVEIHIYPGVGHAFANPSSQTYAPKETVDAWQKTVAFFTSTLKK
ncbi:MAG: dienelactone hydrolase family protein [Candidatus Bathyarchaeia archaeon]|jgi:carboxymethylenebutenolidase